MTALRPYQTRACDGVRAAWETERSVCLVAPTGAGKTTMAVELALSRGGSVLWSAHRLELVSQAYAALHAQVGGAALGVIAPGHDFDPGARVQVGTVQSLLARGPQLTPSTVVLDECHHYVSDEWSELAARFPEARILGATATPQRGDGRPLGDMFTRLIVAAQYSELIDGGYLCDAVVYQPPEALQGGLANDPVAMWRKHSRGMRGFAFFGTIKEAQKWAEKFTDAGYPAACISAKTPKAERIDILARFAAGELTVITNVDTMTEGVDVPAAGVCLLARSFRTVGAYIQAAGRVLRPHPSKEYAVIIDLVGATLLHSPPTIDRIYSLDGAGIRKEAAENPCRNCLSCGMVYLCSEECCPGCATTPPPRTRKPARIYSLELQEVWAGEHTADDAKQREYLRLRSVARARGFGITWVIKEYRSLFGAAPVLTDVTPDERRAELLQLQAFGRKRGFKPGFASVRYKEIFGTWPARTV